MSQELLELARAIALEAGELAARRRREGVRVADTKSTVVDVVTEADREVERLIRSRLADARPDDGILGEEGGGQSGSSGLTWVIDPIDGTTNYLYGIPHYAVSIAVVEGEPDPQTWVDVAGAVHNPASGELFSAASGQGATLSRVSTGSTGDVPITINPAPPLQQALIGTGFAYASEMRGIQGAIATRLLPTVRDIRRQGTASLDLAFVACGRLDAYYERTLSPWDHAAGAIIARAAGAVVKGIGDRAPGRDFILAAHPDLAPQLEAALLSYGVAEPPLGG